MQLEIFFRPDYGDLIMDSNRSGRPEILMGMSHSFFTVTQCQSQISFEARKPLSLGHGASPTVAAEVWKIYPLVFFFLFSFFGIRSNFRIEG